MPALKNAFCVRSGLHYTLSMIQGPALLLILVAAIGFIVVATANRWFRQLLLVLYYPLKILDVHFQYRGSLSGFHVCGHRNVEQQ